jgi:hypothetical protein
VSNETWLDETNDTEGGLTRTGTVTFSRFVKKTLPNTAPPIEIRAWEIRYSQDGRDKESKEEYGIGKVLEPSADGETLIAPPGKDAKLNKNAGAVKVRNALKASGFDLALLKDKVSALEGARFIFNGEPKLDKDGKPKTHKYEGKDYQDFVFYPAKFLGFTAAAQAGKAAAGPVKDEAVATVVELLAAGPLTRAQLISKLSAKTVGNPNAVAIIGMAVRDDFHTGAPWKRDASGTISL